MKTNLTILENPSDYEGSMKLLKQKGLHPLTYQEALSNSEELIKAFKRNWKWFWLAGKGIKFDCIYSFADNGDLISEPDADTPINKKVMVWSGTNPLSLVVNSDDGLALYDRRFDLGADGEPSDVAPVVVGIAGKGAKHKHRFVCECGKVKR